MTQVYIIWYKNTLTAGMPHTNHRAFKHLLDSITVYSTETDQAKAAELTDPE